MKDIDKMTVSIEKLQPDSEYVLHYSEPASVDEALFNTIDWVSTNSLTWTKVKEEMDKL